MTLLLLTLAAQEADSLPKAADVLSRMIARYHGARTLSGRVASTVRVGDRTVSISTEFQLERPNRIYVRQTVQPGNAVFLLTGDGKRFSYDKPIDTIDIDADRSARLIETHFPHLSLGDLYRAAGRSLAERSIALDLAIADPRDLKLLRDQWATVELTGTVEENGETLYRIVGQWRATPAEPVTANFGLFVNEAGDLRRYVIDQLPGAGTLPASRAWTVDVRLDAPVNPELFRVVP